MRWRNPVATLALGDRVEHFTELFEDPTSAETLIAATQQAGERQLDAALHTMDGLRWQRIQLHTTCDPTTGEPLMVVSLMSIDDLVRATTPRVDRGRSAITPVVTCSPETVPVGS